MQLGSQTSITAGDTRRYRIDYTGFLQFGETLSSFTLSDNGPTSSVQGGFLDVTETQLYFFVTGGNLNELFTVSVQVKTNYGETVNDTIQFIVTAP